MSRSPSPFSPFVTWAPHPPCQHIPCYRYNPQQIQLLVVVGWAAQYMPSPLCIWTRVRSRRACFTGFARDYALSPLYFSSGPVCRDSGVWKSRCFCEHCCAESRVALRELSLTELSCFCWSSALGRYLGANFKAWRDAILALWLDLGLLSPNPMWHVRETQHPNCRNESQTWLWRRGQCQTVGDVTDMPVTGPLRHQRPMGDRRRGRRGTVSGISRLWKRRRRLVIYLSTCSSVLE